MENSTTSVTNSKTGKTLNVANQYLKGYENSGWTINKPRNMQAVVDNIPSKAFDPKPTLNVTQPTMATGATGMISGFESQTKTNQDTYTSDLAQKAKDAEANKGTALDKYVESLSSQQGEAQRTQSEYSKNVDPVKEELNTINTQIMNEQQALRRRLETLDKNTQGLFGGALQDEKNRVERESLAKQADLSVIQMGIQGRYDSAKEIADRAIAVQLEQQKNLNEALKFNYEENKSIFTTAEQRAFESAQADRERKLDKEEEDLKTISDMSLTAMQNGAPSSLISKMRQAKTVEEAYQLAGKYAVDLDTQLKKAQISKAWADAKSADTTNGVLTDKDLKMIDSSPQGKKLTSLSNLYQLSNTYKNLVDTYGFNAVGANKTLLDNAYADLKIAYKEAANLGALTGPDVGIIEDAIKPASGATNYLKYKIAGGKGGVSAGIDQALGKARREALQNYKQLTTRNSNYSNSEYVRGLITPFSKDYSTISDLNNVPEGEIIQTEDGVLLESLGNGQFSPL